MNVINIEHFCVLKNNFTQQEAFIVHKQLVIIKKCDNNNKLCYSENARHCGTDKIQREATSIPLKPNAKKRVLPQGNIKLRTLYHYIVLQIALIIWVTLSPFTIIMTSVMLSLSGVKNLDNCICPYKTRYAKLFHNSQLVTHVSQI